MSDSEGSPGHYKVTEAELAWLEGRLQELINLTGSLRRRRIKGKQ